MKNQIVCGDCIQVMRRIEAKSINLVVTSPPYNLDIAYDVYKDRRPYHQYLNWCREWLTEIYRVLKSDGRLCLNHYLSCGSSIFRFAPLMDLNTIAQEIGYFHHGLAVWEDITLTKRTAWGSWLSASAPYVNSPFEGILVLYPHTWKRFEKGTSTIGKKEFMEACSGVWKIAPEKKRSICPAPFPEALAARCIRLLSYEGDIVLDPFVGSGTTALVAKKLHRQYIGIDISRNYVEYARARIAELDLTLENGGV